MFTNGHKYAFKQIILFLLTCRFAVHLETPHNENVEAKNVLWILFKAGHLRGSYSEILHFYIRKLRD